MNPAPPATAADFGKDLKTFDRLPTKTKELDLLMDQAEKATGPESVRLNQLIREKAK